MKTDEKGNFVGSVLDEAIGLQERTTRYDDMLDDEMTFRSDIRHR